MSLVELGGEDVLPKRLRHILCQRNQHDNGAINTAFQLHVLADALASVRKYCIRSSTFPIHVSNFPAYHRTIPVLSMQQQQMKLAQVTRSCRKYTYYCDVPNLLVHRCLETVFADTVKCAFLVAVYEAKLSFPLSKTTILAAYIKHRT